jgi:3-deoxy-D-manno-octulosonic-acid transferase
LLYNFFIILYSLGIYLASIFNKKAKLWAKGRAVFPTLNLKKKSIWMHCASLGEFEQGRPVLEALKNKYPDYPIVLSFFSPSGYEIKKKYSGADHIIYLPIDTKNNAEKLIKNINPEIVIWVKYEYWFNYLFELKKKKIPVLLISGIFRNSQPFFKWYGKKWRTILNSFEHVFVQNENSLHLLNSINLIQKTSVSGDTRFDRVIEIAEKKETVPGISEFIKNHPVLVAGSTWEDDEAILIHFTKNRKDLKFIIAPHEISKSNLHDLKKAFKNSFYYSEINQLTSLSEYKVLIIDCIGLLSKLYQYATITYVGGGFNSSGIHNTLEAAVYGKPVVFGPVYEKFAEAKDLVNAGAAFTINSAIELEDKLVELINDEDFLNQSGQLAKNYVYSNCGATKKIMAYIAEKRLLTN